MRAAWAACGREALRRGRGGPGGDVAWRGTMWHGGVPTCRRHLFRTWRGDDAPPYFFRSKFLSGVALQPGYSLPPKKENFVVVTPAPRRAPPPRAPAPSMCGRAARSCGRGSPLHAPVRVRVVAVARCTGVRVGSVGPESRGGCGCPHAGRMRDRPPTPSRVAPDPDYFEHA